VEPVGLVYFVQERRSGSFLIKIGATADCPYIRLNQLRCEKKRAGDSYSRFELLGVVEVQEGQTCSAAKHELQRQFETLRDSGDWFRPGSELVKHIQERARVHMCDRQCPDGPSIEEEMRALNDKASAAINAVILQAGIGNQ
jgi:hypothetical protein